MKTLTCFLVIALAPVHAQVRNACVEVALTVTDSAGGTVILIVGLDPTATDGIDPHLGEAELPPIPPIGVFDARIIGSLLGQGTLKNIRNGQCTILPYTKVDTIQFQVGVGSRITICWNLPNRVTWRLQDIILGTIIDVSMSGNGCYTVTNPSAFSKLKLTATYPLAVPASPVLVFPGNNSTNQPTLMTFRWRRVPSAITYHLQIATDSSFSTGVKNYPTVPDTSRFVDSLRNSVPYYWRVRASNIAGTGDWSNRWSFTTIVRLPDTVQLVSPAHNEIVRSDSVRFVWRRTQPDITKYWIERAVDSLFTSPIILDSTLAGNDTTKVFRPLVNNQTYWWRLKAKNAAGWGSFSAGRKFRAIVTSIEFDENLPKEYKLSQNYPNPFNPTTTIEFALPKSSRATLKVFDLLGREVATLVDENLPAGVHKAEWNAGGISSGVYFYRLQAGEFSDTKKLILMR